LHLKDITGTQGSELSGKKIALCVTGSVSITEAPRIARLLMRHGAEVISVLTPKAAEFVSPMIFEWSTGNAPITKLTGRVEHVELVSSSKDRVDLILIAPCTANTLGKISSGVCDEPVSTLACTALGIGIPILIASAMHEPMHRNPIIQGAKEKLASAGVKFIEGPLIESKSKLAEPEEIVRAVISFVGNNPKEDLSSLNFVITAGATREPIDSVRFITNASSGKMGIAIAEAALSRSAKKVSLVHGPGVQIPESLSKNERLELVSVVTSEQMLESVLSKLSKKDKSRVLISAAAPSDYAPVSPVHGKISTSEHHTLNLQLSATKKIILSVKDRFPETFVTAFKAEYGEKDLISKARETLKTSHCDLVVANNVERTDIGFGSDFNEVHILTTSGGVKHLPKATKYEIANGILDAVLKEILERK
jgi:phosphopantothenoylcysteine decarboxylase/phosphopantothenate--cysteine ligase